MKELSRQQIWYIWQMGKLGTIDNEEGERLYNVLLEHPEHAGLWDRLTEASEDDVVQDGVNLVLHVTLHGAVENQLAEDNPPAVRQVLRQLLQKGMGRHLAIHAIANAFLMEIFHVMKDKRPYDEKNYLRELRKVPLEAQDMRRRHK